MHLKSLSLQIVEAGHYTEEESLISLYNRNFRCSTVTVHIYVAVIEGGVE